MIAINPHWYLMMMERGAESTVVLDDKKVKAHYYYYHKEGRIDIDCIEGVDDPTLEQLDDVAGQIENELNESLEWSD